MVVQHKIDEIKAKVEDKIKNAFEATGFVDEPGYYYDHTSGKVFKGTLMSAYRNLIDRHITEAVVFGYAVINMNQLKPFRIEEPLDEESIEVLYGPIIELKE